MGDKVVCVTGASGYIASWVVKLLLRRGYTVNATVRNLSDPRKVEHLKAVEGAEERLRLFDKAIDGCVGVFHTASPVILDHLIITHPQAKCVKRLVFTSSMATVLIKKHTQITNFLADETWFSDPLFAHETQQWYALSKILAEEAAVEFAKENEIDLVVMNPGLVFGPLLQPSLNQTSQSFLTLISQGKTTNATPGGVCVIVDIRDVANAHILAFEDSSANGRYCLVANILLCSHILAIPRQLPHQVLS